MQAQVGTISRKMETKKESRRNSRNKKCCDRKERYSVKRTQPRKGSVSLNRSIETSYTEIQREKERNKNQNVQCLWHNIRRGSTHITGKPEGKKKKGTGAEKALERTMAKTSLRLMTDIEPQIQEVETMSNMINSKSSHGGMSFSIDRRQKTEKIMKEVKGKYNTLSTEEQR